eukprot:CAMPEP_0194448332 /NCGR_PEP_ID=MMETSP0176-20130528/129513_1 /TAXON_ID=216777 /ORGANISM="Proboscia alata, Strain PI-D3" /LENGTH=131 /DNA_ID=CAMNT_0039275297 /DNA_START=354 /DNA_END=746 /DNA_ORIENTATION=+
MVTLKKPKSNEASKRMKKKPAGVKQLKSKNRPSKGGKKSTRPIPTNFKKTVKGGIRTKRSSTGEVSDQHQTPTQDKDGKPRAIHPASTNSSGFTNSVTENEFASRNASFVLSKSAQKSALALPGGISFSPP